MRKRPTRRRHPKRWAEFSRKEVPRTGTVVCCGSETVCSMSVYSEIFGSRSGSDPTGGYNIFLDFYKFQYKIGICLLEFCCLLIKRKVLTLTILYIFWLCSLLLSRSGSTVNYNQESGTRSGQKFRIRANPDPQRWLKSRCTLSLCHFTSKSHHFLIEKFTSTLGVHRLSYAVEGWIAKFRTYPIFLDQL